MFFIHSANVIVEKSNRTWHFNLPIHCDPVLDNIVDGVVMVTAVTLVRIIFGNSRRSFTRRVDYCILSFHHHLHVQECLNVSGRICSRIVGG